jgi:hypothetical protein
LVNEYPHGAQQALHIGGHWRTDSQRAMLFARVISAALGVKETRMISDRALAQEVSACMSECVAKLGAVVLSAQGVCPEPEYPQFRLAITKVMNEILRGVMNPLYA